MGAGVQGLGEAPWLDLDTPAATDGWWARSGTPPRADGHDAGGFRAGGYDAGPPRPGGDSHTLVVDREEGGGGRHQGGREPFLGRWLFGPRLLIVVLVIALGVGLGLGGWWLFSGRFTQVPAVSGYGVSRATAVLTADGFTVSRGTGVHSNSVAKGSVVGTSPAGRVAKGARISLLVSSGPFTSVVPKVHGLTQDAAQAALKRVHLVSTTQKVASDAPVGRVTGTSPPAGTTWPQTKTVTILVAGGPPLPSFVGMDINAAQALATQLNVHLQQQPDGGSQQAAGVITGQEPAAGGLVQPGQAVTVRVSTGPQLVPVPDPRGMTVQEATRLLENAGFQVTVRRFFFSNKVFTYSPMGEAPRGSTITLDVGL
jgi:serine/threonine-protein kinase